MNMVDRLDVLDRMIDMQARTMEFGRVRVTASKELIERDDRESL